MRSLLRGLLTPHVTHWLLGAALQHGGVIDRGREGSKAHCELSFEGHFLCACQPDIKLSSQKDSFCSHGDSLSIAFFPNFKWKVLPGIGGVPL